jgi:phosphomannomutase
VTHAIEKRINGAEEFTAPEHSGEAAIKEFSPHERYTERVVSLIDLERIASSRFKIISDPIYGASRGLLEQALGGIGTYVEEIRGEINPIFGGYNPEPIGKNLAPLVERILRNKADIGLAFDGDADRCGVGDEQGRFINQLRVYALLAYYLLEVRGQRGDIVKTLSTTTMLNKLGQMYGVPVHETGVGFKYVAPKMTETNALIGGEESGGYAFRGNVPERDGILAGLYMLDFMVRTGKKPTELLGMLFAKLGGEYYYDRVDRPFSGSRAEREQMILAANPRTVGGLKVTELVTVDGFQFKLEDGGWMLIRFSGTEPIMRVYCETTHKDRVQAILQDGLQVAGLK